MHPRKRELDFAAQTESDMKQFNFDSLSANNKTDYKLIQNFVDGLRFNVNEFKSYEWDPAGYNLGDAIFGVMDYQGMPLDEKLRNLSKKLANAPAYFQAAKKNIHRPTKEHTDLAIAQNKGSLSFFDKTLPDSLSASKLDEKEAAEFKDRLKAAREAVEAYVNWLEKDVATKTDSANMRSFRIGKELYAKKI